MEPDVRLRPLPRLIFSSRWLQLPLYLGLIVAQAVYVYHFWVELIHLVEAAFGSQSALALIMTTTGLSTLSGAAGRLTETTIMLVVLGLIDVVMISNLTFIKADYVSEKQMLWQVVIHLAFVASAIAIAAVDRIMEGPQAGRRNAHDRAAAIATAPSIEHQISTP